MEGAKVIIQKGLSSHLQTTHTLVLGSSQSPASHWQYGATYVGSKKIAENEVYQQLCCCECWFERVCGQVYILGSPVTMSCFDFSFVVFGCSLGRC